MQKEQYTNQMREGWMIQIKSCVWHNLLKVDFAPHTIIVVLWDSQTSASQDKMIYSTYVGIRIFTTFNNIFKWT